MPEPWCFLLETEAAGQLCLGNEEDALICFFFSSLPEAETVRNSLEYLRSKCFLPSGPRIIPTYEEIMTNFTLILGASP